ncbi:hypothetical protein SDJN02_00879, partial [Cucurbita argyrosperma subsp. argyrosperma]
MADANPYAAEDDLGSTKQRVGGQKTATKFTRNIMFVELKNPQFLQIRHERQRKMQLKGDLGFRCCGLMSRWGRIRDKAFASSLIKHTYGSYG